MYHHGLIKKELVLALKCLKIAELTFNNNRFIDNVGLF